jgi:hypothetical protein
MIPAVVVLVLLILLALENLVFVIGQLGRNRREAAYWDARANRPDLYDWARELDL